MAVLFYDNFHRADGASTGNGWNDASVGAGGSSGILNDQQFMTATLTGQPFVYRTDISQSSGIIVRAEFSSSDLTDGYYRIGILSSDGATSPGYAPVFNANTSTVSIVDDSGTLASTAFTFNNTDKYAFEWDITAAPQNWSYLWLWDATTGGEPTPATLSFTNGGNNFSPSTSGNHFYITAAETAVAPTETVNTDYVEVQSMHTPPVITNLAASASYTEGNAPITLSPSAFVTSPDSHFLMTKATIQIDPSTHLPGDELLVFDTTLGTASTSGTYSGINVSFDFDTVTGILTLSGLDTNVDYAHVLDNIQFHSTSDNPTSFGVDPTRTIKWQITDADVPSGPDFALPVPFDAGASAGGFAVSAFFNDINQDLIPDFVVTNPGSNTVSILYGNGNGTFQAPIQIAAGTNPTAIAETGQLDGFDTDFFSDLVVVNAATNQVSVLLGNGSTFEAPITTSLAGVAPTSVTIGDFNEDSKDDIAVAMAGANPSTVAGTVLVMPGDGTGHFGAPVVLATALNPTFVTTVNLHSDTVSTNQHTGLAAANTGSNSISIFMGAGTGAFVKMPDVPVGTAPVAIVEGRFKTSDPGDDLAVVNSGSNDVTVLFGHNDGTFSGSVTIPVGFHPNAIVTGNFNGDNFLDFVTANGDGTISLVYGHGDGTFDPALTYQAAPIGDSLVAILTHDLDGSDFASDGNPDLAVLDATGHAVSVVLHNPTTQSIVYSTNINVAGVNDPPVNTVPGAQQAHISTPHAITDLAVADPDATTMTVTLTVQHGTIHVLNNVAGGLNAAGITSNDSNSVTLSGNLTSLNTTLAASKGVVYTPTTGYLGPDTLAMHSDDGGQTGSGGPKTDDDSVALTVTTNVVFGDLNNHPNFKEDVSGPVVLDNNADVEGAATDNGAVLTLQRHGGANPDDVFQSGLFQDGTVLVTRPDPDPGDPSGFIDVIIASYLNANGVLTITFNSDATPSDVNAVLQSLTYANASDNPPTSVQIDYSFNDTVSTATAAIVVAITPANDPPTLDGVSSTATYAAGSSPIVLAPGAMVTDPDSPTLASATVTITGGLGGDVLNANAGATPLSVSYDPATFTLTLSGAGTSADYQQVLRTVTYAFSGTDPTGADSSDTRTITWQVNDGGSTRATSNIQSTSLGFTPFLDLDQSAAGTGFATSYTENGAGTPIGDTDVFIHSSNGDSIASASIVVTNAHPGDTLFYDNSNPNIVAASDTSNPNQILFSLTGSQSVAAYQTALHHVFFASSSDNPDTTPRQITVAINDEVAFSNTAVATISITPVNDPPVAQNGTLGTHVNHAASGAAVATDPDNTANQLSYSLVGPNGGAHGTVVMNSDGSFTYTPAADFAGPDSFRFSASDPGLATSNTASISVTVTNDRPVITNVTPATSYTLGSAGVVLSPALHAADDSTLKNAIVQITDGYLLGDKFVVNLTTDGGGHFIVNESGPVVTNISVQYNALGKLVLAGADTPQHYQEVLDAVAYTSTAADPTNAGHDAHRTVTWQVNDGTVTYVLSDSILVPAPLLQTPAPTYGANSPFHVENADLNGDGALDLVTAGFGSGGTVSVLLGSTATPGTFGTKTDFPAGSGADDVAIADLNGDGKLDLAVADFGAGVSILLGNGAGGFGVATPFAAGGQPAGVGVADFNGDGIPDLAVANQLSGNVSVLLGTGAGNFGAPTNFGSAPTLTGLVIGDFNNDGKADIAATSGTSPQAIILIGNGSGGFAAANTPSGPAAQDIVTGDVNGDGKLDLVTANAGTATVSVMLGDGSGGFGLPTNFAISSGGAGLSLGDFNADGKLDIATINFNNSSVSVLLGNGNGTFQPHQDFFMPEGQPFGLTLGDFNRDGGLDAAAADSSNNWVALLFNTGTNASNVPTTLVSMNRAPVAQNGSASGNEDNAITGNASASDPDSDPITFALVGSNGGAAHGSVSLSSSGGFTYTPTANFNGADSFNFHVTDDHAATSNTATISITVNPVNDAPVAQNGSASGNEDNTINGTLVASDVDGDPLSFSRVTNAAHGNVTVNANGTFSYTPNANFNGADSFTFNASDNHAATSNTATVSITVNPVNDAPVAQNGSASGNEDNTINGNLVASDVDGDPLSFSRVTNAAHGNVTVNANGTFSYTPNANFNGADSFTFTASDNHAATSNTATISITVNPVNDAPVAQNGSASGNEDNTITGTLSATDVDGDPLSFSRVANAAHGNVTVNANGTFSYTPNANFNGTDSFTFNATDNHAATSNTATISITVNPVNDPPVIVSDGGGDTASLSVPENTTAVTTVVATDIDSPSLTYSIAGGTDVGKFQINASTGALSFIAAPDFENPTDADHNNSYIVQVRASDGSLTDDQLITVSVTDVAEPTGNLHWMASVDAGAHAGVFGPTEAPVERWVPAGIGDFNGDATSDLAWYNSFSNSIDIWKLSNGGLASSSATGAHPAGYQPAGFGDFNHDGTSDVLWFNPTTRDLDLWKISNGQWAGSVDIGTHPAGYSPSGVGDFNGDGTSDVLWYNAATRDAEVWKISNGQWAGSVDVGTHPAGYQPALTGDFNGDGTSDIAWYNSSTGDVDIWKISNGQWAGSSSVGAHPAGWQPLGAVDFNKDGTSDIAWYNPTTNDIDVWLIKNGQWAGSVDVGTHPAGWTAIGVGDFDHNGVGDIMWLNNNTGHIENWLLAFS